MKIVRNVQFQVKHGKADEFTRMLNNDVIPTLRKQEGFTHEFAMINGDRALGISIWKDRASADKYENAGYSKVLETLAPIIEGTPKVDTYELAATSLPL
ncbi:MAG: antibiotic biosynthesis monooxygenase [Gemmatimonadales bacterium]